MSVTPTLSWTAGDSAGEHDVYLGTTFGEVNDANDSSPEYKTTRALGSETYAPGTLELGKDYYWRIDEVNGSNTWPGDVWIFTVVPPDPPYGLDRGNWLFLKWGLQVQALAGQVTGNLSLSRWDETNFSAVYASGGIGPGSTITTGRPWGAYGPGAEAEYDAEVRARMINAQFKDEQDITQQSEIDEAEYALGRWRLRFPNAIGCTNQARDTANNSEMRTYMQQVEPDMLCFDWYPFFSNNAPGGSPTNWYVPLARYRMLGLEGNDGTGDTPIPYGTWLQTWIKSGHVITESELRLNQFASWAFGYKFAAVFFYNRSGVFGAMETSLFENTGRNDGENDDNPTATFYEMAETNRQSRNLGPTLVRLISTDIRFIRGLHGSAPGTNNDIPSGVSTWNSSADPYITSIDANNLSTENNGLKGDVLVGYFNVLREFFDGPNDVNELYFMIVNGLSDPDGNAVETQQEITIAFDFDTSGITELQRLSRDTGEVETVSLVSDGGSEYHLDLVVDGGTGDLFKFNTGAPFVTDKAYNPYPADSATDVDEAVTLTWSVGVDANSHDVYLGTDSNSVGDANNTSDEFMGNFSSASYNPPNDLDFNTVYYWAVDEVNGSEIWPASVVWSFTVGLQPTTPTVVNSAATNVTSSAARLNGDLTDRGGEDCTVHIYWGDNDGGTTAGNWDNDANLGTKGEGTFYTDISSLTAETTYYFRCYATNSAGSDWADSTENFTTEAAITTLLEDGFEDNFDKWTDGGTTDWDRATNQKYSGSYSAHCGNRDNDLISDNLDTSSYSSMTIVFWYRDDDIDDSDDIYLQLYDDGSNYDNKFELGNTSPEDTWHKYETTINNSGGDAQYFHSTFRIKFEGTSIDGPENLWIDDVLITVQ